MLRENLKNFRKAQGLTQKQLADQLNVVRQTVSKWERGLSIPDPDMLQRLAEALNASAETLLGETVALETDIEKEELAARLERLNEQLIQEQALRRRQKRRIFCALGAAAACALAVGMAPFVQEHFALAALRADSLIIGGSDGPTSIYLEGPVFQSGLVAAAMIALLAAAIGLYKTRK
ncbi:MAG: helix-turn-helix transcriptional regulator [Clostridia bacterium]|nr:helix-turn-helix transcriptional regulator [Clostridia bacterium]